MARLLPIWSSFPDLYPSRSPPTLHGSSFRCRAQTRLCISHGGKLTFTTPAYTRQSNLVQYCPLCTRKGTPILRATEPRTFRKDAEWVLSTQWAHYYLDTPLESLDIDALQHLVGPNNHFYRIFLDVQPASERITLIALRSHPNCVVSTDFSSQALFREYPSVRKSF